MGGDNTIAEIRQSPLRARSYDLVFADRFSLSVINSKKYLNCEEIDKIATGFYYDTFFSDQNACNSPRLVIWDGTHEDNQAAQTRFWKALNDLVLEQYHLSDIAGIDKLVRECSILLSYEAAINKTYSNLNYINVIDLEELDSNISLYKGNCGMFMEIETDELESVLKNAEKDWQTITYYGYNTDQLLSIVMKLGLKGIDRIVPIGKAGVPSLKWDGVDFIQRLSREITVE